MNMVSFLSSLCLRASVVASRSDRQALAAGAPPAGEHRAAAARHHAGQKSMLPLARDALGLICPFGHATGSIPIVMGVRLPLPIRANARNQTP